MHSKKSDSSLPFSDPILFVSLPEVFLEVITPELSSPDTYTCKSLSHRPIKTADRNMPIVFYIKFILHM